MFKITVSGRDSRLSKAQIEHFARRIKEKYDISSTIRYIKTYGDKNTGEPIHNLPITNPFVKEVHQSLFDGTSDIGVSSLKDVEISSQGEIETVYFSERKNPRDVLLLSKAGIQKIRNGGQIIVGTSSLRRQYLFANIFQEILPNGTKIEFKSIRGNITTRIALLDGQLDGIIIAIAGILRLYDNRTYRDEILKSLQGIRAVVLPISHFATPPGQGIIVGQISKVGQISGELLEKIHGISCMESERVAKIEKTEFARYGKGCRESYGVTHLVYKEHECTFINGQKSNMEAINLYTNFKTLPKITKLFDTRTLSSTFKVKLLEHNIPSDAKKFIVSNFKSVNTEEIINTLKNADEVWAAGFETMKKLASVGILCNGCLESLGTDALPDLHFTADFTFNPDEFYILTHSGARKSGGNIIPTYESTPDEHSREWQNAQAELQKCDAVFWSSITVYELLKSYFKSKIHLTLLGNTYNHLKSNEINPYGFFNHEQMDFYLKSL